MLFKKSFLFSMVMTATFKNIFKSVFLHDNIFFYAYEIASYKLNKEEKNYNLVLDTSYFITVIGIFALCGV